MLYALAVQFTFLVGGLTGIPLAMASLDLNLSDTYFIPGHFHYVMAVSGTFAIFGGIYYIYPKMTGRMYSEKLGWAGFIFTFAGINLVFFPMMIAGLYGMPRRYFDYEQFPQVAGLQNFMSIGAVVILVGAVIILWDWIYGLVKGAKAPDNPWGSRSLEWATSTPPPPGNFGAQLPEIAQDWHPYAYGRQ
jgi:cytochrome c oxidase subunit 1